jgi:hypothetical protein
VHDGRRFNLEDQARKNVSDQVVTGIFTLHGVAMGLFGERSVRTGGGFLNEDLLRIDAALKEERWI